MLKTLYQEITPSFIQLCEVSVKSDLICLIANLAITCVCSGGSSGERSRIHVSVLYAARRRRTSPSSSPIVLPAPATRGKDAVRTPVESEPDVFALPYTHQNILLTDYLKTKYSKTKIRMTKAVQHLT